MSSGFDCNYGDAEFKTVASGIEAIKAVLDGEDISAKQRLLYYLDWYMDPYYKKDMSSLEVPLKELLQMIVITPGDESVIEEAMHLLEAYAEGPYDIFAKNMDKVPEEYRPTVLYLMNEESDI